MLGITFKENCQDIRNKIAIDIYTELMSVNTHVDIYYTWADPEEVMHDYGVRSITSLPDSI